MWKARRRYRRAQQASACDAPLQGWRAAETGRRDVGGTEMYALLLRLKKGEEGIGLGRGLLADEMLADISGGAASHESTVREQGNSGLGGGVVGGGLSENEAREVASGEGVEQRGAVG